MTRRTQPGPIDWAIVSEFIRKPLATGTLLPSSPALAQVLVQQADLIRADAVLEYGAGTGVITPHILARLKPRATFAAIEINPRLAKSFREAHPDVRLFVDSAENARSICDALHLDGVDCVISGLPWALFSESMQVCLLDEMMRVLRPGGRFVTFGYLQSLALPHARDFAKKLLPSYFKSVTRSSVVWLNFPPAIIYRCER